MRYNGKGRNTGWAALLCLFWPVVAPLPVFADGAIRTLPGYYSTGCTFSVSITIEPPLDTVVAGLEDSPPPGWTEVDSISEGGAYDAETHKVKWGPFFTPSIPAMVSYNVTPPGDAIDTQCFAGTVSFDGFNQAIGGSACLPQDCLGGCDDEDDCTVDTCVDPPGGTCTHECQARRYGDVYPVPVGDGAAEIMDTLCILDAAGGEGDCLMVLPSGFIIGDIWPCLSPEGPGPDGAVEIMDTLAILDAADGEPPCLDPCTCR